MFLPMFVPVFCLLANRRGRSDISHTVSTTFRNLIAFFS
jgi:hypothetical protein